MVPQRRHQNQLLFTTWNIRGLGTPIKRYKKYAQLKRRGSHIGFIQEMHLVREEGIKLQKKWRGQLFCTYYSSSRGVAIWVKAQVPFVAEEAKDPQGRYVLTRGRLDGLPLVLGSFIFPTQINSCYLRR